MTTTTHPDLPFGRVIGRFLYAMPDTEDLDRMPDAFPAVGSITITSMQEVIKAELPVPTTVIRTVYTYDLDSQGYLVDKQGTRGVWLIEGAYKVSYNILGATIPSHDILVLSGNDADHPIDLLYAQPPGGPVLTASQYAELNARLSALEMTSVGLHASSHAEGGSDPVTPASIGALQRFHPSNVYGAPTNSGLLSSPFNVDEQTTPGVWWVSGQITPANGFPDNSVNTGILHVEAANSSSYLKQTVTLASETKVWTRVLRATAGWSPWVGFVADDDPRLLATDEVIVPTASLLNGWGMTSSKSSLQYFRDRDICHVYGSLRSTESTASDVSTLPLWMRPTDAVYGPATNTAGLAGRVFVSSGGTFSFADQRMVGSPGFVVFQLTYRANPIYAPPA